MQALCSKQLVKLTPLKYDLEGHCELLRRHGVRLDLLDAHASSSSSNTPAEQVTVSVGTVEAERRLLAEFDEHERDLAAEARKLQVYDEQVSAARQRRFSAELRLAQDKAEHDELEAELAAFDQGQTKAKPRSRRKR